MQRLNAIPHSGQHTLNLVVLSFYQGEIQTIAAYSNAGGGTHGFGVIIQHNACQQSLNLLIVHRMFGHHTVDLGHMLFR